MARDKHRLVTRADFDGVVCGGLLMERGLIDDVAFAEPNEMQSGAFPVRSSDITANLPYVPGVHHCFDHHASEVLRVGSKENLTIDPKAPSAARVVYEFYGGASAFPSLSEGLIDAVDKADSAQFDEADILSPDGWVLVNFILDPRTGLCQAGPFGLPDEQFMKDMMVYCRHHPVEEILKLPDVAERIRAFWTSEEAYEMQLRRCARIAGKTVIVDLRDEAKMHAGNRFTVYALYPDCNLSITIRPRTDAEIATIAVGKSILNRTSEIDIGALLLEYGGGGHAAAGTCHATTKAVDETVSELIARIGASG